MARRGSSGDDGPTRGTAPSAADMDKLEKMEPSEEAKRTEPSDVDAMGQDKRRAVVGHSYGPSRKSQLLFFAAVAGVGILLIGGYFAAIAAFDQPKDTYADKAPWSQADAEQIPTRSPSGPCGEPGNPYPFPEDSPCATEEQTSDANPPAAAVGEDTGGDRAPGELEGPGEQPESGGAGDSGGATGSGDSAESN